MKRLLHIGSSIFCQSIIPIITWIVLGAIFFPDITIVFSLTYPLQFISLLLISFFGTAANIKAKKQNKPNSIYSGLVYGFVVGLIVMIICIIFLDEYITFMQLDKDVFRIFTLYIVITNFSRLLFSLVLEKLYFEDKERAANIHSIIYNLISFISIVFAAILTKNQITVIVSGIVPITIYSLILYIKQFKKFKFDFDLLSNFKYESMNVICYFLMFISYFFGYSNAFQFGPEYVVAINFVTLISDAEWDCFEAISTSTKIDIANETYNHKKSQKNNIIYSAFISSLTIISFFMLYSLFKVDLKIGLLCLSIQVIDMMISPIYYGFDTFLQLSYSPTLNTLNHSFGYILRFVLSTFIANGLCVIFAQIISSLFMCIIPIIIRFTKFKLKKNGVLVRC